LATQKKYVQYHQFAENVPAHMKKTTSANPPKNVQHAQKVTTQPEQQPAPSSQTNKKSSSSRMKTTCQ
jgi:hypothetical protein